MQFAPRHEVVAAELSRVLKPGGRIALCSWERESFVGRLFGLIGEYSRKPPPEASPPGMWGDEDHVRALFAPHGVEVEFVALAGLGQPSQDGGADALGVKSGHAADPVLRVGDDAVSGRARGCSC